MTEKILSKKDIDCFLSGAEILGTGGGGGRAWASGMLKVLEDHDKKIRIIDPVEVPNDALVVGAAGVGGGVTQDIKDKIAKKFGDMPPMSEYIRSGLLAEKMLSGHLGENVYATLAFEIGCGNTILPGVIAAMIGRPLVDGDCNGRAVPEIELCTLNVKGFPFTPIAIVTPWNETMLVKKVYDYSRAEDICRYMAVVSGGGCMTMGAPLRGRYLANSIVKYSVSNSIKLGKAIQEANNKGKNPVEAAVNVLNGYLLFSGEITYFEREEKEGFMWGEHHYKGTGDFEGKNFKIWYKNEHQISWLNDEPYVTCPDLICVLDSNTGQGLSNWGEDFKEGRNVSIISYKADDIWRSVEGLKIFNPKHFGFDIPYEPVENIVKKYIK